MNERDERMWAMFSHLAAFAGFVGIPLGNVIGPLVVWLIKKDESPLVEAHGRESLNFQISCTIYMLVSAVLMLAFIGFVLIFAVGIFMVVYTILGAVAANDGRPFAYPLTIRFIK